MLFAQQGNRMLKLALNHSIINARLQIFQQPHNQ